MQSLDENPPICERCKQRPATARYTYINAGQPTSDMVCAACFDWLSVYFTYHDRFRHISDLEDREQYDEALACLDEILEANRHLDHEKWLARSIARDRAIILRDAGRYAEAEQACKAWADLGFVDVGARWLYGSVTAQTLEALGRSREGFAILEDVLSYRDPKHVPGASGYLERLAVLSERLGQPVDPNLRSLAQEVAERHGVEMPKHESLSKAILDLAETIRKTKQTGPGEDEPSDDNDES